MTASEANAQTLQAALNSEQPVVIQFWAEWCAPCRAMIPIVDQFAAEQAERVTVVRVDIDAHPELSVKYRVTAVPTFVVARGEEVLESFSGAMPLAPFSAQIAQAIAR